MAQQVTFWKMEGKSDVEIKTIRLNRIYELAEVMANLPDDCDIVTVDRSDKQSNIIHEVWQSNRYIDLNER